MNSAVAPRSILIADCFVGAMGLLTGISALFQREWMLAAWCGVALLYVAIAIARGRTADRWRRTTDRLSSRT